MAGIFISYRREDSIAYAGRLHDRLLKKLARRHALHLPDIGFRQSVSALIQALEASMSAAQVEGKTTE